MSRFNLFANRRSACSRYWGKHVSPPVRVLAGVTLAIAAIAAPALAQAAWYDGGVLVSNVCRAPSGAYWVYPPVDAQPVGTSCSIPLTGELGTVTMN
jgi:hypothetical protein